MIRMFDFRCGNDHTHEAFVNDTVRERECPVCGQIAQRQISTPRVHLEGTTGAFPGAAMQWERKRAEKIAQERKQAASHGE